MGNVLSEEQNSLKQQSGSQMKNDKLNKNWKILEKTQHKEILKSLKTSLIIQRYWFQMENYEDFQQQNKLFEWRNNNPNHEIIVNVLSINKEQTSQCNKSFQCASIKLCPSQKISNKVYIVTQRILKLAQINDLIAFQQEVEKLTQISNVNQSSQLQLCSINNRQQKKKYNKLMPFINMKITQLQAKSILKDWIRGIQVLCYKFGYFGISYDNLAINSRKKGNVWISDNYSLNHLDPINKIQVLTAEQKFKYQKQTINKILLFLDNIAWFKNIVLKLKYKKIQRFDDLVMILQRRSSHERNLSSKNFDNHISRLILENDTSKENGTQTSRKIHNILQYLPNKKINVSLYAEPPSFIINDNSKNHSHNNSSFFQFDHKNILRKINSNLKYNVLFDEANHINQLHKNVLNQKNNIPYNQNNQYETRNSQSMRNRSNTGQKILKNISPESRPQSKQNINFINSNHKNCGKQTAPTNQLGHSSSLQSVHNFVSHVPMSMNEQLSKQEGKGLFKTHNNTKINSLNQHIQSNLFIKPSGSPTNKIYFHHRNRKFNAGQAHLFRSQNYNHIPEFNSPKSNNKRISNRIYNYSLDQNNIVGPYRKDKFYSNLKKQKIVLVDSMVIVREQSQQIQQDAHNMSGTKIIMEESIILMGRENPILATPRQSQMTPTSRKKSSFYH